MKQSRPMKKKKKERTWAEAATIVLQKSNGRSLGIREIQQRIYDMKLKDIKMNKLAENVLKTMLSHHSNMANCPFYKIKERSGYYALKTDEMKSASPASSFDGNSRNYYEDIDEDSNGSNSSSNRPITRRKVNVVGTDSPESPLAVQNGKNGDDDVLITSVREKSVKSRNLAQKALSNSVARRSNSYTGNPMQKSKKLLSRRRTSSPMSSAFSSLRSRSSTHQISRRSASLLASLSGSKSRSLPILDLETPNSILTNTRLKSIINSAIFSMIPASYQYQLIQLLPKVDQDIDINNVPRISSTALNNEFFSQALQDWSTQLSEGEFTRETQARIMQELAKERSKIQPWKENFFEEYYGQKTEIKRTRSRSHDATSNLADLSFEAQVFKFQHLRDELDQSEMKTNDDQDELVDIDSLEEDSESEHDPDYRTKINAPPSAQPRKYPSSDCVKAPVKEIQLTKPINRRKNGKPFKRTLYNSIEAKRQAPSLMHREMMLMQRRLPLYAAHTPILERFGIIANRSNFQMHGREFYNSESDLSDSGAVSDSNNSFHEHDESDDDDSSDSMMNVGDDNLMDVDRDSESDQYEDMMNVIPAHSVNAEHSYTRLPMVKRRHSANDEKRERSQSWCQQMVVKPLSSDGLSNSNTTLVLRPRGNLGQTVQSMNYSEDSSSTSPEQPYKKSCLTPPSFDKIVKVAKVETSREERVGVLFGRGVHSSSRTYTGDVIVPRIAPTERFPVVRSGALPCSSVTLTDSTANVLPSHMNSKTSVSKTTDKEQQLPTGTSTENHVVKVRKSVYGIKLTANHLDVTERSKPTMVSEGTHNGTRKETKKTEPNTLRQVVATSAPPLSSEDTHLLPKNEMFPNAKLNVSTSAYAEDARPEPSTTVCRTLWPEQRDKSGVSSRIVALSVIKQSEHRMVEQAQSTVVPQIPTVMKMADTAKTVQNSPIYKRRALPATNASPVKRTRTLAEIKAQMKAKKAAAAATASPLGSNGRISALQNSPLRKITQTSSTTQSSLQSLAVRVPDHMETRPVEKNKEPCPTSGSEVFACEKTKDIAFSVSKEKTEECSDSIPAEKLEVDRKNTDDKDEQLMQDDTQSSSKIPGIIIMKIEAEEGKKYTVKLKSKTGNSGDSKDSDSNSDSDEIVRNTRKLRKVISSSDDSSVASTPKADRNQSPVCSSVTGTEPRSDTPQPSVAGTYMAKVTSIIDHPMLFKKTQKSPVFGEPAFDSISLLAAGITQIPAITDDLSSANPQSRLQPFMSDKPVIGFQDIPSCFALSLSNVQTTVASFASPTSVVQPTKEAQKYRSMSKGKSLVQMQQMARNNQIHSDESEMAESESEEDNDSTASTASSAEEEDELGSSISNKPSSLTNTEYSSKTSRDRQRKSSGSKKIVNHNSVLDSMDSDEVDSYDSSSDDPGITECFCACKRLVLCKGCGAYTHQECLSASSLCSLCV